MDQLADLNNVTRGAAMNPMSSEMYEGYGNFNSMILIIGWFIYLMTACGIAYGLRLTHKKSIALWVLCNVIPIIFLLIYGYFSLPAFLGLFVMAAISYSMGKAVFDNLEKERRDRERFLEEESRDLKG